jgi:folylpolyglutamate synthase/dihydropteroate synthase
MVDKDRSEVVSALLPHVDSVICTAGTSSARFEQPTRLAAEIRGVAGTKVSVEATDTPAEALQHLAREASEEDEVLVAGSLYLVGDVRELLGLPPG